MKVLIVEPFYGGSHKQLIDFIVTLPGLEIELVQCVISSHALIRFTPSIFVTNYTNLDNENISAWNVDR